MYTLIDLKNAFFYFTRNWKTYELSTRVASLTYYALFSLIPLLFVLLALSSFVIDGVMMRDRLVRIAAEIFNERTARLVGETLTAIDPTSFSGGFSVAGALLLIIGATTFFVHLRSSLHKIFRVREEGEAIERTIWDRIRAFLYILLIFSLFFVLLLADVVISVVTPTLSELVPRIPEVWIRVFTSFGTLVLLTGVYGLLYRSTSHKKVTWRSSLKGGLLGSFILVLGSELFASAVTLSATYTEYGAFSASLALLLWLYIFNATLCLGALYALNDKTAP